ncbi:phospholipase D-like domain-containing protein [Pendulispora rubella]|uniref:Phospholipase D-like domain-containing protein n=1 Tax=Pendulispora rubella TaxID=2741070 RepID=A0ABZ2LE61_9BACT
MSPPPSYDSDAEPEDGEEHSLTEAEQPWFDVGGDRVRLLRDGAQTFPAMLEAIRHAQNEVLLEMYWVGADSCGERFRDALVSRARAGVKVKVIYDAVGSLGITESWWQPLRSAGGDVHEYHSLFPLAQSFQLDRVEQRDHRKLLVADDTIAFTGGINLSDPWLPLEQGGEGWRDDAVAVEGPCVEEFRSLFYETWRRITRTLRPRDVPPFPRRRSRPVWVLANNWRRRRSIRREYVVRIANARQSVDIANSYFVPDGGVRRAMFRAASRGVRIRVLVPARGDVPIVQFAVEAMFEQLLKHGVEVYALPGPILHSKVAIVDESFATIGSYNLDERSWRKNLEVNLAVEDGPFARHVRHWFEHDLARALPIDLATWRQRGTLRRGMEWVAFAMRKLW